MSKHPKSDPLCYGGLLKSFQRREARYEKARETLEQQIAALQQRMERMKRPYWINDLIKPIGEALLAHFPGRYIDILGPFGLCSEVGLHLYREGVPEKEQLEGDNCLSISFVHDGDRGVAIRDYSRKTNDFPPNSIGAANGMNYAQIEVPDDADVEWFKQHVH